MQLFLNLIKRLGNSLNVLGAVLLSIMMMLTVLDVFLRYLGCPFTGTFELMSFGSALVVGFALAQTTLDDAHVKVDIVESIASDKTKASLEIFNKLAGAAMFILLAWALFDKARDLHNTREVCLTLHVPYYPAAYVLSFCCLVEAFILFSIIFRKKGGERLQ